MYWMKHPQHGEGPVETMDEVNLRKGSGWELVPYPQPAQNPLEAQAQEVQAVAPEDQAIAAPPADIFGGDDADSEPERDTQPAPPASLGKRKK